MLTRRQLQLALVSCLLVAALAAGQPSMTLKYPEAPKSNVVDDYHGTKVADPYRGLENSDTPESMAWIEAENKVTRAYLDAIPGRDKIKARLTTLYNFDRYSAMQKAGPRYLTLHNDGLQNQNVLMVSDAVSGKERVLLDPNTLRADGTVAMREFYPSPEGKLLAYGIGDAGSDWVTWHVRDIETGKDLDDLVRWSKFSIAAWSGDGRSFFYQRYPEPKSGGTLTQSNTGAQVYLHRIGTKQETDELVYERPDHKDWLFGPAVSDDGRYLLMSVGTGDAGKSLLFYKDLKAGGKVVELIDKLEANYYFIGNQGAKLYIYTTGGAPKGKIIAIDLAKPGKENWKDIVPEQKETVDGFQYIAGRFVMAYLKDAADEIRIYGMDGKVAARVALPGVGSVGFGASRQDDKEMFFSYTAYTEPVSFYRLDPATGKADRVRGSKLSFDPAQFESRQVFYTSKDGTRVPMSLVHRKGIALDGKNPTLLYGYGGFNISLTPFFSPWMVAWMERGGIFAVANIRGGAEYGEAWHEAGIKDKKQNVFDDFIAAAEWLIAQHYTSTPKLAIMGGSNGGLLIGAVLNQRPDLFGAAMPAVGVMDMLRFHKFTIGAAWTGDYGSSDNAEDFKVLYKYSPLHNIRAGVKYPPTLITTADHDDRVVPGHSFKYAATLQAAQAATPSATAPILIRIETRAGHGGGTPVTKSIEEYTDRIAFLSKELGMQ